jgi:putative nucleotidyltransferase with HDIG domain
MQEAQETLHRLQESIGRISNLPTPPMVFEQINRVINNPKTSAYEIAAIISEDPALSVKVLKLSNSAFYGLRQEVTSIKQAIVIMGIEAVRSLVLSTAVFDMFRKSGFDPEFQERFWRHSLATAFSSRLIVRKMPGSRITEAELAFSVGLLHDIGQLVLFSHMPTEFALVKAYREVNEDTPLHIAEQQALGYTHADVGALLALKWKLPGELQDAIQHHHLPQLSEQKYPHAYVVHVANYLAHLTIDNTMTREQADRQLSEEALTITGIAHDQIPAFREVLLAEYSKAETFVQMATSP